MNNHDQIIQIITTRINKLSDGWKSFFNQIITTRWWIKLINNLSQAYSKENVSPEITNLFLAFELTPIETMKVMILGQDPYPTPKTAIGLAFAINSSSTVPGSLKNIIKKLSQEYKREMISWLDLKKWAVQGVFLINTALSVITNRPNSHSYLWAEFSNHLMQFCAQYHPNLIYVGWGNFAQKMILTNCFNAKYKIFCSHPSPLSAQISFFKTPIFKAINLILQKLNQTPIIWW
ncbi:Uracil-DNA glycosylase, family 1 [[Mycoplasma] cavipharyngis]|uniref:uracil-DNA glycosylase n=1 Tax=[Mycoplasma] cavipharyngis TaxID=92757 RepID=UPI0037043D58